MSQRAPILVTGGAGFIGSHLVERLLHDGQDVVVIDDLSTGSLANLQIVLNHPRLRVRTCRVSDCPDLDQLVAQAGLIYHLAAAVGVELVVNEPVRCLLTNLRETEAILAAAAPRRAPLILASTSEVYGKSTKAAFAEEDDLLIGPPDLVRWGYACSKLMDEFLAMAHAREKGLPAIIARIFNTVGPRQTGRYGMVLPRFVAAAQAAQPLRVFGDGSQSRCFCYVLDTVEALVRLARCPAAYGQVFNIGSTEEISILALAELVIRTLGSKSTIERVAYTEAYGPGFQDMQRRRPVIDKLTALCHFRPATPLREVIRIMAGN